MESSRDMGCVRGYRVGPHYAVFGLKDGQLSRIGRRKADACHHTGNGSGPAAPVPEAAVFFTSSDASRVIQSDTPSQPAIRAMSHQKASPFILQLNPCECAQDGKFTHWSGCAEHHVLHHGQLSSALA